MSVDAYRGNPFDYQKACSYFRISLNLESVIQMVDASHLDVADARCRVGAFRSRSLPLEKLTFEQIYSLQHDVKVLCDFASTLPELAEQAAKIYTLCIQVHRDLRPLIIDKLMQCSAEKIERFLSVPDHVTWLGRMMGSGRTSTSWVTPEAFKAFNRYAALKRDYYRYMLFHRMTYIVPLMETCLGTLQSYGIPGVDELERSYEDLVQNDKESWDLLLQIADLGNTSVPAFLKAAATLSEIGEEALTMVLLSENNQRLLSMLFLQVWRLRNQPQYSVQTAVQYMFMLDKLGSHLDSIYAGCTGYITASLLAGSLRNSLVAHEDFFKLDPALERVSQDLDETMVQLLSNYAVWDSKLLSNEEVIDQILCSLSRLNQEDLLFIPAGSQEHAIGLSVEKTAADTFRITIYNTGEGIEWHPHRGEKVQTFLILDEVPQSSIFDRQAWQELFRLRTVSDSIEPVYACIFNQLGAGGVPIAASQEKGDYESPQASGTCSAQNIMAFIRHRIMSITAGTPQEKLACYRIIKSLIFSNLSRNLMPGVAQELREISEKKLSKLTAELKLAYTIQEEVIFENYKGVLIQQLPDHFVLPEAPDSLLQRFHQIYALCKKVAKHWSQNQSQEFVLNTEPLCRLVSYRTSRH